MPPLAFVDQQLGDIATQDDVVRTNIFTAADARKRHFPRLVVVANLAVAFEHEHPIGADVDDATGDVEG